MYQEKIKLLEWGQNLLTAQINEIAEAIVKNNGRLSAEELNKEIMEVTKGLMRRMEESKRRIRQLNKRQQRIQKWNFDAGKGKLNPAFYLSIEF